MKEGYLHYLFDRRKLGKRFTTTLGKSLTVESFGELNPNSGPDFLMAAVRLEEKTWHGHIEFHIKSSDWLKHGHQDDPAYKNVIAHFVLEHDREIMSGDYKLPVVELKNVVDSDEAEKFNDQFNFGNPLPCIGFPDLRQSLLNQIPLALQHRLNKKSNKIITLLSCYQGDQLKTLIHLLFLAFGGKVNQEGFVWMAEKFELEMLSKLDYDDFKIQAYLHGLSGFLANTTSRNNYVKALKDEFSFQKELYQLKSVPLDVWKSSAFRPAGHPTNRIAQLASLLSDQNFLHSLQDGEKDVLRLIKNQQPHTFWSRHTHFNASSSKSARNFMSDQFIDHLIINTVVPYYAAMGKLYDNADLTEKAVDLLKTLKPEQNNVIRKWKRLGIPVKNAADSQALIEMKTHFCRLKKCLQCKVGQAMMQI